MILIYWKWKVGSAVGALCDLQWIPYEIHDDSDMPSSFDRYEKIIPSPGVPVFHRIYQSGKIISELDFAYQFLPRNFTIIAVTGTDGKSTTSWILYNLLKTEYGEEKVYISGNFDVPFSATVREILTKKQKRGYIVVEVSSFMSYSLEKFSPEYSIFTNFKPDHLNWHGNIQEYLDAKMNLIHHTKKSSIINNQVIKFVWENKLNINISENIRMFGSDISLRDSTDGENIKISGRKKYLLSETHFSGQHNAMNILASTLVMNEMKICSKRIKDYLKLITWLPHRLETIGEKRWITFVEDSKSTSSQSLEAALGSYMPMDNGQWIMDNLLLIVWGSDKWDNFTYLAPLFVSRVKAMVCIGATKNQFIEIAKQSNISYLSTDILIDGVNWLYEQGSDGDILMLSPGCASFGLFRDYLDRANQFREIIKNLPN